MAETGLLHRLHKLLDFGYRGQHFIYHAQPTHKAADTLLALGVGNPQIGLLLPKAGSEILGLKAGQLGLNGRLK